MSLSIAYSGLIEHLKKCCANEEELSNLCGSEMRAAKALEEMMLPYAEILRETRDILKIQFKTQEDSYLVVQTKIKAYSMCPHHLLPISYEVDYGYKPLENFVEGVPTVLGLSKLVRLAQLLARRPILQEVYVNNLISILQQGWLNTDRVGNPTASGVGVYVMGLHGCIECRGVRSESPTTIYASTLTTEDQAKFDSIIRQK